jgi:hypothetical protein
MRTQTVLPFLASALFCGALTAAVVDRVAVVVGKVVITESEVLEEIRLTGFLNEQPLDFSAQARREAADRLVDQQLLRQEMEIGNYQEPAAADVDALTKKFRQEHYPNPAEFQNALEKYGITERQLRQHLAFQLKTLRFTDLRFRPLDTNSADRSAASDADRTAAANATAASVDQEMDAWLKQARAQTRVAFKKEAFQ